MNNSNGSDEEVEQDVLGNDRKLKQKHRHDLRLNYDSDSSIEDYEDIANGNGTKHGGDGGVDDGNDDDDDMFASDKDEAGAEPVNKSKKTEVRFLDITEFEKNEGIGAFDEEKDAFVSEDEVHGSDAEEDDDEGQTNMSYYTNVEDFEGETRQLNKKDPKFESFDLNDEANEGKFDIDGNFIPNNDDDNDEEVKAKAEDDWINSYKKSDIHRAKRAQDARAVLEQENRIKSLSNQRIPIEELLERLINHLEPSETCLEALSRLNPKRKRNKTKKSVDISNTKDKTRKEAIVEITDLCDELLYDKHLRDVYDLSREELMRKYEQETGISYNDLKRGMKRTREDDEVDDDDANEVQLDNYGEKVWEFKWIDDDQVLGPYSNYEMNHWKQTYFEDKVMVRKVGDTTFVPVDQVNFEYL